MVKIYQDYDDEPDDVFLPLPEELGCQFYGIEMDGFQEDIDFYKRFLPNTGKVLDLGCGTGRIPCQIARRGRSVIGIDVSLPMTGIAREKGHPHCSYLCMDMAKLAFNIKFDAILIAYNSLNLLTTENQRRTCLEGCKTYLQPGGKLLAQIFVPTEEFIRAQKKSFQFQMFDHPSGGKIIKEIIKQYVSESGLIRIEERYRVRPLGSKPANRDWIKSYNIAGFSADYWLALFNDTGFSRAKIYGDYTGAPYSPDTSSCLLISLNLQ